MNFSTVKVFGHCRVKYVAIYGIDSDVIIGAGYGIVRDGSDGNGDSRIGDIKEVLCPPILKISHFILKRTETFNTLKIRFLLDETFIL